MANPSSIILASDVAAYCGTHDFLLTMQQATSLAVYLELLLKWNQRINMVGFKTWQSVLGNLVLDSFHLGEFIKKIIYPHVPSTWDLGAGAGLPGIPLRMVWTDGDYWMVESREKRALFLATALSRLALSNTSVFHGRAEAFMPSMPAANIILSRAFIPWPQLLKLVSPYLHIDGHVILLSSMPVDQSPDGWRITASTEYSIAKKLRYFYALSVVTPINAPS